MHQEVARTTEKSQSTNLHTSTSSFAHRTDGDWCQKNLLKLLKTEVLRATVTGFHAWRNAAGVTDTCLYITKASEILSMDLKSCFEGE